MVILITGYKRAGKDTVAQMLTTLMEKDKWYAYTYSLSQPIKELVSNLTGCSVSSLEEYKDRYAPVFGCTYRDLFRYFGTTIMRNDFPSKFPKNLFGDNFWAWKAYRAADGHRLTHDTDKVATIIPDVRFWNEIKAFAEEDRPVVIINVDNGTHKNFFQRLMSHPTERYAELFPYDFRIKNTGTLEELEDKVAKMWDIIKFSYETTKEDHGTE